MNLLQRRHFVNGKLEPNLEPVDECLNYQNLCHGETDLGPDGFGGKDYDGIDLEYDSSVGGCGGGEVSGDVNGGCVKSGDGDRRDSEKSGKNDVGNWHRDDTANRWETFSSKIVSYGLSPSWEYLRVYSTRCRFRYDQAHDLVPYDFDDTDSNAVDYGHDPLRCCYDLNETWNLHRWTCHFCHAHHHADCFHY